MEQIPVFRTFLAALMGLLCIACAPGKADSPAGKKITEEIGGVETHYSFCAGGRAMALTPEHRHRDYRRSGTWKMRGGKVLIQWTNERGEKGIGKPANCDPRCVWKKYASFKNKINRTQTLDWTEIKKVLPEGTIFRAAPVGSECR